MIRSDTKEYVKGLEVISGPLLIFIYIVLKYGFKSEI